MRICIALCCALFLPLAAFSQGKAQDLKPTTFKVGQVGYMKDANDLSYDRGYPVRIDRILGEMKFRGVVDGYPRNPFIVDGFSTKDLADDSIVKLPGLWKVARTHRDGGRTYYVIEPHKATPKKK